MVIGLLQVTDVLVDTSKNGDPTAPPHGVAVGNAVLVKTAANPPDHHSGEEQASSFKEEVCFISNLPINAVGSEYMAAHTAASPRRRINHRSTTCGTQSGPYCPVLRKCTSCGTSGF